ncbi:hypothetical protein D3C86_747530 [compost metagenome]
MMLSTFTFLTKRVAFCKVGIKETSIVPGLKSPARKITQCSSKRSSWQAGIIN